MEGVFSFFLESTFLGLFLFGEKLLGPRGHWWAAFLVFLGSWLSGFFIVATNAWMQHPVGYRIEDGKIVLESLGALMPQCAGIRRAGAAALDLAYVAAGRMDGFWEFGLSPWDFCAGVLLIREAGGMVSDLRGGEGYMDSGDIACGTPRVHREMLKFLRAPVLKRERIAADKP